MTILVSTMSALRMCMYSDESRHRPMVCASLRCQRTETRMKSS